MNTTTETHPSWGLIRANNVRSTPGARLFDSEIDHGEYVVVTLTGAERQRKIGRDWIRNTDNEFEIAMSKAQWGAFVSSFGDGSGVPCTIQYIGKERIEQSPNEGRLKLSVEETRAAADRAFGDIQDAYADVERLQAAKAPAKEIKEAMHTLKARINNATPNVAYAAKTLAEHTENVVTKARADIEAMAIRASQAAGYEIETPTIEVLELEEGDDE